MLAQEWIIRHEPNGDKKGSLFNMLHHTCWEIKNYSSGWMWDIIYFYMTK